MKKNGDLIITAPFCSLTHFAPYYYSNGYSKYWYKKILEDHGFDVCDIDINGNYFEYIAQELRRLDSIAEKYSSINKLQYYILRMIRVIMLRILHFFSKNDTGSQELLCFGLHIYAKKK